MIILAFIISALAALGNALELPQLSSWSGGSWVTMKYATCFAGMLSALAIFAVDRPQRRWELVCGSCSFVTLGIMIEKIVIAFKAPIDATNAYTISAGVPSIGTVLAFTGIMAGLLLSVTAPSISRWPLLAVIAIGVVAMAGYVVAQPLLYWWIPGKSTGMAINTAVVTMLLSLSILRTSSRQ